MHGYTYRHLDEWISCLTCHSSAASSSPQAKARDGNDCLGFNGEGVQAWREEALNDLECLERESLPPAKGEQDRRKVAPQSWNGFPIKGLLLCSSTKGGEKLVPEINVVEDSGCKIKESLDSS